MSDPRQTLMPVGVFEACAMAAHEANRAYCIAIGDKTQPSWEGAPAWMMRSARDGVRGVLLDGNDARSSHELWMTEKYADGWVYGEIKNPTTKERPCLVPWEDLPPEQRAKDELFVNTVIAMAKALGVMGLVGVKGEWTGKSPREQRGDADCG
jgi:hypothetical protein